MNGPIPIPTTYDYRLVTLSVVIAILASYVALDLMGRITASQGRARFEWLIGGAFAMGAGIWSMHYVGMLAFRLPIRVYYHLPTVALSLGAAVLSSAIALYVVSRDRLTPGHVAAGSVLMGVGIATMHYTGMAAMRLGAMHYYRRGVWTLSVVLAVVISFVGLVLISYFRDERHSWNLKVATAIVMGLAIPTMHYTGMAAVRFVPIEAAPDLSYSVDISVLASSGIVVVTFLILGLALVATLVDRRLSANQLKLYEEREMLRALIDNIPDFMYVKDMRGRFVVANSHAAHTLGVETPHELLGKTDFDFFSPEVADAFRRDERTVIRSGQPLRNREEKIMDKRGIEVHILTTKVPLRNRSGKVSGVAGVGRDITDRKLAEEALRRAHQDAEIFINAVPSILIGLDQDSRVTRWNLTAASTFGFPSADVVGKKLMDCPIKWSRPDMQEEIRSWCSEQEFRRCDGIPFDRENKTRLLGLTITRVNTADKNSGELLVIGSDITDRHMLEGQLRQAQKLESVGQLASGIAHEINTPTQYIGDNVRFLKDAFQDLQSLLGNYEQLLTALQTNAASSETVQKVADAAKSVDAGYLLEEIPKAIDQALEGVTRVAGLVKAMKEFSHPDTKEKTALDLNHAIASTITVARSEWKYVADLETDFDPALPPVYCQPGEFNQVILNLIVNAAHAIADAVGKDNSGKGKIKIQTRNCEKWVEIRIQDSGTGIPQKVQARIFDPFFTTKEIGKGTGQGLAIARSVIVDKQHGTIHFETEEGRGTTFVIRLPHESKTVAARKASA